MRKFMISDGKLSCHQRTFARPLYSFTRRKQNGSGIHCSLLNSEICDNFPQSTPKKWKLPHHWSSHSVIIEKRSPLVILIFIMMKLQIIHMDVRLSAVVPHTNLIYTRFNPISRCIRDYTLIPLPAFILHIWTAEDSIAASWCFVSLKLLLLI